MGLFRRDPLAAVDRQTKWSKIKTKIIIILILVIFALVGYILLNVV